VDETAGAEHRPRAVAVVTRDHEVLVIKRYYDKRDYAVLPGGSVEPGETFEEAKAPGAGTGP
jgi:8-oxo-dGTP pyrophosphatase MutT (NUDIX family)